MLKMPADPVPGEDLFLACRWTLFLCPHMGGEDSKLRGVSYKNTNGTQGPPPHNVI